MSAGNSPFSPRRIPKQQRALAKYEAVLDACTVVLAEYGYEKTTVMELSLTSGVAVPTIYQYFPNKESIFVAWLDRTIDQLLSVVTAQAKLEIHAGMDTFIHNVLTQSLHAIDAYRDSLRNLLTDLPHLLLSHAIERCNSKTTQVVSTVVADYAGANAADALQPKLTILMQCILGFVIQHILQTDPPQLDETTIDELSALTASYLN